MSDAPKDMPAVPGGPDPSLPVPREPVDGFDLAAYAAVAAQLAEGADPRAAVLARSGLDEARWLAVEQTWLLRVAIALLQQDYDFIRAYSGATEAAREAIARDGAPLPIEAYAALIAGHESGREPGALLAEARLTPAAFARHKLAWERRLAVDAALRASFRAMVEAKKRAT
ncbi:hypothetical protein WMF30_19085 [Sorangium sp. So ce134]